MSEQSGKPPSTSGLPSVAVSRAMLAMAPGKKKLDLILDSPDPRAFVRRLPAEDLYFAIKEVGLADASEVIGLASPTQFRSFVDLDAWENQVPEPDQILRWLQLALEGARHSGEFRQKRAALDRELVVLVLKTQTIIHSLEEEEDPVLQSNNYVRTAEGKYLVEITAEGEEGVTARRLIEDFIEEDPFGATRLFEAVRWEMKTELEESALRWRTGRMRDMGFPTFEEAIRIWTPLPAGWRPREARPDVGVISGVPALLLSTSRAPLLLDRVAERLPDEARPVFNEGLLYLLNCAIVADGIDPKDLDLARGTLAAARDMLSLGLELASDGDEERALAMLSTNPPVELFRLAVTQIAALTRKANSVVKAINLGQVAKTVLDTPEEEILVGLRKRRPRLYDPVRSGEPPRPEGEWRAFRTRSDLQTAEAALRHAKAAGEVLALLGLDAETAAKIADAAGRALTAVTVSQLLLTAALKAPEKLRPLSAEEAKGLCQFFERGQLTQAARERFAAFFTDLQNRLSEDGRDAFAVLATRAAKKFEDEIGHPCAAGGLDPRFVECVLVTSELPE